MPKSYYSIGLLSAVITILTALISLYAVSVSVSRFGVTNWNQYQYVYIMLLGSFNMNLGRPYASNYFSAKGQLNINTLLSYTIKSTMLVSALYSGYLSYFLGSKSALLFTKLSLLFVGFNLLVILRNHIEASISPIYGIFIKSINLLIIVTLPLINGAQFSIDNCLNLLLLYVFLMNSALYTVSRSESQGTKVTRGEFNSYSRRSFTGLVNLYVFNFAVLSICELRMTIYLYSIFLLVYEVASKTGIFTNLLNVFLSPRVSRGELKFRLSHLLVFIVPLVLICLVSSPLFSVFFQLYTGEIIEGLWISLLFIYFILSSLLSFVVRMIVANGGDNQMNRILMLTNIGGIVMLVIFANNLYLTTLSLLIQVLASLVLVFRLKCVTALFIGNGSSSL